VGGAAESSSAGGGGCKGLKLKHSGRSVWMMGWGGWGGRLNVLETFTWMGVRVRCEFRQLGVPTRRGEAALSIIIIILTTGRNHFQNWEQGKLNQMSLQRRIFFFYLFGMGFLFLSIQLYFSLIKAQWKRNSTML